MSIHFQNIEIDLEESGCFITPKVILKLAFIQVAGLEGWEKQLEKVANVDSWMDNDVSFSFILASMKKR